MKKIILISLFCLITSLFIFAPYKKKDISYNIKLNENVKIINYNGEIGYLIPESQIKDALTISSQNKQE